MDVFVVFSDCVLIYLEEMCPWSYVWPKLLQITTDEN